MKVLLLENVQGLGKKGEIVEVKDGYGQNFLIAKGKAQHATNEVINKYKAQVRKQQEIEALEIAELHQMKNVLEQLMLVLHKKVGANDTLFGSITKEEIAAEIEKQTKMKIDKKHLEIPVAIKHLGQFQVLIKLGHGIHTTLNVEVKAQG
ncbi:50S ribosomal protein L9 [Helicobacter sp. MIT 05-5293]|uniref:Large ribosomal subunit protein bL9 n=1 Tax=uncultured Helicobacter sp. TaxID=175537 RepID=A0A650EJW0_9HELI|nr:50S ribosomal protein L9 [Helicobacter sp. MIT 05-5293]QGT50009.1 50S ribosomal protein L9 [uncultured Helicobacter sp.]TLD81778.1 50S ribosomal protein L9 [Helicobacter sp. MIT 05-5293]